jgi:hypothetical protein
VPTQTIALAIAILLVIVFGVSFLVEKTIDLFLGLLVLGPVVLIVAAAALIQGLVIGLRITDHHGLLNLLGGWGVRLRSDERAIGGNGSGGLDGGRGVSA